MTHEDIWRAIEKFATEHNMSCSGLAKCSGLDPTTFNKSKRWSKEGQPRWPSTNSISKILDKCFFVYYISIRQGMKIA